jgi:hypothetical protein
MRKISQQLSAWGLTLAVGAVCFGGLAQAAPLDKSELPAALKDWLPWVMHGEGALRCPAPYNGEEEKPCVWPARLELRAGSAGASFRLEVQVFGEPSRVGLPGDATAWPQDVKVAGRAQPVSEVGGRPTLLLSPGRHQVEGLIPWAAMPQDLALPEGVGSLVLSVDGAPVSRAADGQGRVWLKQPPETAQSSDAYTVHTTRLIDDGVPLRVTTHYDIAMSGKPREIELPAALLAGMVPESIESALPVRLQGGNAAEAKAGDKGAAPAGGSVWVQARSGNWTVEVVSRLMSPVESLALPAATASTEEVWSFAAHNEVRLVSVEGATTVDPKQVAMPEAWRGFPAYRLLPGQSLKLVQTRRGNPLPNPDQLKIARQLWLDFDGQGYTVHDDISGSLSRSSRLEMAAPGALGRAATAGEDQPITRLKAGGPEGLEVRSGAAQLSADSRVPGAPWRLPASGWLADFNQASAVLNLPPGWRLLHATGVDQAEDSWVSAWTLWDFFFVLLSALAAGRLMGWKAGAVLGAALVLSWHMPGVPQFLWLGWLGFLALGKVLPEGRFLNLARGAAWACAGLVALVLLPYAVHQVRLSIYPVLEQPWQTMGEALQQERPALLRPMETKIVEEVRPAPAPLTRDRRGDVRESVISYEIQDSAAKVKNAASPMAPPRPLAEVDPGAKVQTGPGLPTWAWTTHRLSWQGPVQQSQTLGLVLLPPAGTVVFRLGGLALMVLAWLLMVGRWPRGPWPPKARVSSGPAGTGKGGAAPGAAETPRPSPSAAASAARGLLRRGGQVGMIGALGVVSAVALMAVSSRAAAAELALETSIPASAVLEDMRNRLTAPPDCMPACAEIARMRVEAAGSRIQLRLEVHALADVALPLPGQGSHWQPTAVTVDGKPAVTRRDASGALWVAVSQGVSQVVLEADAGAASVVDIVLPMPVREVKAQLTGWSLSGLDARGLASGALSLSREQAQSRSQDQGTQRDALPPLVRVERTLRLGLRWTIETQIVRVAPSLAPLQVKVRLAPGETVNDDAVQVKDGVATLSLGAQASAGFQSSLKESPVVTLSSSPEPNQIEVWKLDASTQWHASLGGIAPVLHQEGGRWMPTWQPWPGEQVSINVTKPEGVAGQTFTVDGVETTVTPGARATDVSSKTSPRSSLGGNHRFELPPQAELLSVSVDGQVLPVQPQGGGVVVPITPGAHVVQVDSREPRGIGLWFQTTAVNVGAPGVNDRLNLKLSPDRVVLALGGPSVGPAVLFWGVLLVIVAVAIGLGRLRVSPLSALSWALLGVGVAQMSLIGMVLVAGWFLALEGRRRWGSSLTQSQFKALQLGVAMWSVAAAGVLFETVQVGLLGYPDLMVIGNASSASDLHWYADRFNLATAQAWVVSVPVLAYRLAMLLWALWLAASMLRWVKWGWACFSEGGYWPERRHPEPELAGRARPTPEPESPEPPVPPS